MFTRFNYTPYSNRIIACPYSQRKAIKPIIKSANDGYKTEFRRRLPIEWLLDELGLKTNFRARNVIIITKSDKSDWSRAAHKNQKSHTLMTPYGNKDTNWQRTELLGA